MIPLLLDVAHTVSTDEGTPYLLLLLGPAGAVGVYWGLYRYYRNTDKSHSFEKETLVVTQAVRTRDTKVGDRNGTSESEIDGANSTKFRERVRRIT